MYVSCHIRICSHSWNGEESKSTCSICVGGPGRLPAPSPLLRWRSWGGEGWRAGSSLGILSREGGISGKQAASWNGRFFWRVNLADYSRGWIRQVATARYFSGSFWRIYLAGHFGAFIWRVILAHFFGGFSQSMKQANFKASKKRKRTGKECTISESLNCIMNIVCSQ